MFRQIDVHVTVDPAIRFQFAEPLSILTVTVTSPSTGDVQWELIHDGFKEVDASDSSSQVWPIDEAPAWALRAIEEISARETARIKERGPYLPARESLAYGEVPPGYREEHAAKFLAPGKYNLIVFAEQGNVATLFEVPA